MKVARKFTLALLGGMLIVQLGSAVHQVRRERLLFEEDTARDSRVLGRTLAHAVAQVWDDSGPDEALAIIDQASEREAEVHARWVWIDPAAQPPFVPAARLGQLAALGRGHSVTLRIEDAIYTYVPVRLRDPRSGAIEIAQDLAAEGAYVHESVENAVFVAGVLGLLCALLAWLLGMRLIARPVGQLVEQARAIGRGELGHRVALRVRDELGELAREMDLMSEELQQSRSRLDAETQARIAAIEQLRHADRLSTLGTLASGIAHELGTPINVIEGHAQLLREDARSGPGVRETSQIIANQCKRMAQIIRQLLDFSRRGAPALVSVDAREVARETLKMVAPLLRSQAIGSNLDEGSGEARVAMSFHHLQQVLANIAINAIHAMPRGGKLELRVERVEVLRPGDARGEPQSYVSIACTDTGTGIDPAAMDRIFEPFFTTKEVGEGTGLGLSVAHGLVDDHGGWISAQSVPGQGSRFTIFLPPEVQS